MKHSINLRWVIGTSLANMRGGSRDNASIEQVDEILRNIHDNGGSLSLTLQPRADIGPESLDVRTEDGRWIANLCENTETDFEVRTFLDPHAAKVPVAVLGDFWDGRAVCRDFAIIQEIVRTFFETGNVGVDHLS